MKTFATLYRRIDAATSTQHKRQALIDYLRLAVGDPKQYASAAWTVYFLAGGKPRQMISTKLLRQLALEATDLPEWLLDECYHSVGDLAETLALLLPPPTRVEDAPLDLWMNERLLPLRERDDAERLAALNDWVDAMPSDDRLPFFKLVTGELRIGVSKLQMTQAIAQATELDAKLVAQRMMGYTQANRAPQAQDFVALVAPAEAGEDGRPLRGQPYPFFLAHSLQAPLSAFPELLGPVDDWLVEWKFDGIRAQFIHRAGEWWVWSRGEELVSDSFPELAALVDFLPDDIVLDGELIVVAPRSDARSAVDDLSDLRPFSELQQRLGRKVLTPKMLRDRPVALIAYDLLEKDGHDLREKPQRERRALLEEVVSRAHSCAVQVGADLPLRLSPALTQPDWESFARQREEARARGAEGMMLKAMGAPYGVGRQKSGANLWWKWKLDPMSVDAVLIYAARGHGRRSGVYSDYTFGVWSGPPEQTDRTLLPFAKAYSGLSDEEMRKIDATIRRTTIENFGPVRSVRPTMVFELGFEGIGASNRHKSGIAVRFPRMLRWRQDKPVEDADTIEALRALLPCGGA
ncbi:ATP-dependent DNA ligase [Methylocystis sp.]|uniref:ATP-dependent DNA ligase n=1 Tax=Methylocystis sp. TaxID=1911079 RepID=UPI003DA59205